MRDLNLGKLERVEVRKAWEHEAHVFTPWLADNLDLLAEELGIELDLEGEEVSIGQYRADIVARNSRDNSVVLIENQLETADLQHLGQILAYMAGLDARTIIWVATGFNDIHRSAIHWLNEHTVDEFSFFAVQVGIVRIGDSKLAPVFEVLERPSEWERQVQEVSGHGKLGKHVKFRREFWTHFAKRIPDAPGLRPDYAGGNVWHRVEEANLTVVHFLARDRVGLYLIGDWGESREDVRPRAEPYFDALRGCLDPDDDFHEGKNHLCVATLHVGDTHDRANWDKMVDWLDNRRRRYEKVLKATPAQKS